MYIVITRIRGAYFFSYFKMRRLLDHHTDKQNAIHIQRNNELNTQAVASLALSDSAWMFLNISSNPELNFS